MDNKYDAIVVGAGNGGLVSALTLLEKGYNVLLLDEHNDIGGLTKSIRTGRFEFEPLFHTLFMNNPQDNFNINKLLKDLDIDEKVEFSPLPNLFRVITLDAGKSGHIEDYKMPFGINEYIAQMENYVPNSSDSLREFFNIAYECKGAIEYISNTKEVDYDYVSTNYPNFSKIATLSVSKAMDILDIPLGVQEILNVYWLYFGSPETELGFPQYASFIYDAVNYGLAIPTDRSYSISFALLNKYLELGGTIKYNSKVIKLMVDDEIVNGLRLYDGTLYYSDHIIMNASMSNVYNNLINTDEIPRKALRYMDVAKLGGRLFSVYLGLNHSYSEFGFDSYNYFIYHSLDSDMEFNRMKDINNGNLIANVLNVANNKASVDGTCILELSTVYFDDCFKNLNYNNYEDIKNNIVNKLIDSFETATKIKIRDYIEEIEVVTPVDVSGCNGNIEGSIFGYRLSGEDHLVNRLLSRDSEKYIKGLYLCGGLDGDIYNHISSYKTGLEAALNTVHDLGGDK